MATNFESSIHKGSDLFFDFPCFICQESERNIEAEFYCEECSKLFCGKCVELHNSLFKKHATLGKGNIAQWPVPNVDALEQCQEHKKELTGFCEDHSELICHVCHVYNHQKCRHVVLIADKVKDLHQKEEFKQLSMTVDTLHRQLMQKKDDFEENLKSLEKSYKQNLEKINHLRKTINDSLDHLERNTIKELNTLQATLRTSIRNDIENCTESINNLKFVQDNWLIRKEKSEAIHLIMYRQCLDQSLKTEVVLQDMKTKNEMTLTFNADPIIQQTLSTLTGLGHILSKVNTVTRQTHAEACDTVSNEPDFENQTTAVNKPSPESTPVSIPPRQPVCINISSDQNKQGQVSGPVSGSPHQLVQEYQPGAVSKPVPIIKVKSSNKYTVKGKNDYIKCQIYGICETATRQILIIDSNNCNVKLLDQTYRVVDHCDLQDSPRSMCSIDSSMVAVTLYKVAEVHFIRVTNCHLIEESILKLKHRCHGIAHHQGNLYITDGDRALYHYTVDGKLLNTMYEDTSGTWAVTSCAVSPDGDRIYVVNNKSNQLVTLSKDGKVISTLTDPAWRESLARIHVTDSGQVLVCGGAYSNTIIQVDRDGRQKMAEVVTVMDGVEKPISVYYSQQTGTLIVGMLNNYDFMVFQTQ